MFKPSENGDTEIVREFAGGAVKIEREFNVELDRVVEYSNVLGVKIRRRDGEIDRFPGQEDGEKIPVFDGAAEQFADLSFGPAEIEFLQAAMMRYAIGHHTLFLGPPGFGKSRMLKFFAYLLNIPYFRVQCEKGMNVQQKFLWAYVRDNGTWKGRLGALPLSMMTGGLLHVDEINNLEPEERQVILEPTERPNNPNVYNEAPELHLGDFPGRETTITANPGWFLAATGNYREGQSMGEIKDSTEREERRVRPYMLGSLPQGTDSKRMAGRYRKESPVNNGTELRSHRFYPPELLEIPDRIVDAAADFFEVVHTVLKAEVLKDLRQDPKVFLNEINQRAFDQFMILQVKKAEKEGVKPYLTRMDEMLESAVLALEFYYVNAFREEVKMKLPDHPASVLSPELKEYKRKNERVPVRTYVKWRIRNLLEQKFWEEKVADEKDESKEKKIRMDIRGRIFQVLSGIPINDLTDEMPGIAVFEQNGAPNPPADTQTGATTHVADDTEPDEPANDADQGGAPTPKGGATILPPKPEANPEISAAHAGLISKMASITAGLTPKNH